jgi:hypothetical protein
MKKPRRAIACRDIFRHICVNLDQELDSPECRSIRKHIEDCPDCVAYLDSLKKTVKLYREYPNPTVPAKVRRRLFVTLNLPVPKSRKRNPSKAGPSATKKK